MSQLSCVYVTVVKLTLPQNHRVEHSLSLPSGILKKNREPAERDEPVKSNNQVQTVKHYQTLSRSYYILHLPTFKMNSVLLGLII